MGSSQQVGEYALGMAVAAPVILFANLQLRSLLASDVQERFCFAEYLRARIVTITAALMTVAVIAAMVEGITERAGVILLVGCAQALEIVSDIYYGFMQKHGRMDRMSRSLMIRGPLSLLAMWLAMHFTGSLAWTLVALALARLLVLFTWDRRLGFAGEVSVTRNQGNRSSMPVLLRLALPLGVISMLVSLNANIPRYFVESHEGSAQLGMFSAVASLLSAGSLVVSASGQAVFLPVARACASGDRVALRRIVVLTGALGAVLGVVATLISLFFGRAILAHLFRPEYGSYADILVLLMIAGTLTFIASGWGFVVTAAQSLHPQVPLLLGVGIISALTSWMWIPRYGLKGAAGVAMAAAVAQLAGTAGILFHIDRHCQNESSPQPAAQGPASLEMETA